MKQMVMPIFSPFWNVLLSFEEYASWEPSKYKGKISDWFWINCE